MMYECNLKYGNLLPLKTEILTNFDKKKRLLSLQICNKRIKFWQKIDFSEILTLKNQKFHPKNRNFDLKFWHELIFFFKCWLKKSKILTKMSWLISLCPCSLVNAAPITTPPPNVCGDQQFNSPSFLMISPQFPLLYAPGQRCNYRVIKTSQVHHNILQKIVQSHKIFFFFWIFKHLIGNVSLVWFVHYWTQDVCELQLKLTLFSLPGQANDCQGDYLQGGAVRLCGQLTGQTSTNPPILLNKELKQLNWKTSQNTSKQNKKLIGLVLSGRWRIAGGLTIMWHCPLLSSEDSTMAILG